MSPQAGPPAEQTPVLVLELEHSLLSGGENNMRKHVSLKGINSDPT